MTLSWLITPMVFITVSNSYIQVRSNLRTFQSLGNVNEVTCGGNALKFYAAIRMRIMRTGLLKSEDEVRPLQLLEVEKLV